MNSDQNNYFESLLHDKKFIDGVLNSKNSEEFLLTCMAENPENKEVISYAADFLRYNRLNKTIPADLEIEELLQKIRQKENSPYRKAKTFSLRTVIRCSAAAIFALVIGYSGYLQYNENDLKRFVSRGEISSGESELVLSDGTRHVLSENNSEIEYDHKGKTIRIKKDNEEKVIENKSAQKRILNEVIVPFGKRHEVKLSDGTVVTMNSGSKLVFPANFEGLERKVFLLGEARFDVTQQPDSTPFVVETDYVDVKVLGTNFNVAAYSDEEFASVVLVGGSVNVSQKNRVLGNMTYRLNPGQGCFYKIDDAVSQVRNVDVENYISWTDGWIKFENEPFINVIRKIRKYYNKSIQIEGEKLANTSVSGKLVFYDDYNKVVENISKVMEVGFEEGSDGMTIIKSNN